MIKAGSYYINEDHLLYFWEYEQFMGAKKVNEGVRFVFKGNVSLDVNNANVDKVKNEIDSVKNPKNSGVVNVD